MTVKIGMGGSALDLSDAKVWGNPANKIMVGMGSSAIEAWSAVIYPLTGTFEIVNGAAITEHEVFAHTVVEPGNFTVKVTPTSGQTTLYGLYLNGASKGSGAQTTATFTGLSVGDTIRVTTLHTGTLNLSGTWSVVKN